MFNPQKTTRVESAKVRRAAFWYEVKLYLKVFAIVFVPFALLLWALMLFMDRI
jgi:hypothetical protein